MTEENLKSKLVLITNDELINKCRKQVTDLAKTYGNSHRMSIPPQTEDTDIILTELIDRFKTAVKS